MDKFLIKAHKRFLNTQKWLFAPRDILIRSHGEVKYIHLGSIAHGLLVIFIVMAAVWTFYASDRFVFRDKILKETKGKVVELEEELDTAADENKQLEIEKLETENMLQDVTISSQKKISDLEMYVEKKQNDYSSLVSEFTAQIESAIADIRRAFVMADVDISIPMSYVQEKYGGIGGPIELSTSDEISGTEYALNIESSILDANNRMMELRMLQELLPALPLAFPLDEYWVSSSYGWRKDPINNATKKHFGIDLVAKKTTTIMATAPGKVIIASYKGAYGKTVVVDHGFGIQTLYGHLHRISVEKGDIVDFRQKVGELGSSGRSTGPHVHYEVRFASKPQNPINFFMAGKNLFKPDYMTIVPRSKPLDIGENINITEEEMDDDSQAKTELLDINSSLGLVDEILPIPKPNV